MIFFLFIFFLGGGWGGGGGGVDGNAEKIDVKMEQL